MIQVKRVLVSVSDKTGLLDLVKGLLRWGAEIISTGGTYKAIEAAGYPVTYISEVTGFPEILDGRVKTLHPAIHGGILALRTPEHLEQLAKEKIAPIDLVVVNLYPFEATVAKPGVQLAEAIENIDIGGPTMIRSAAKNNAYVGVVTDPADYQELLAELEKNQGGISEEFSFRLAVKAFCHTARYDSIIYNYLSKQVAGEDGEFPPILQMAFEKVQTLRYGENPHQKAAFYRDIVKTPSSLANAEQLQGKELSFNNINDGNAAWELVREFTAPAVVAIKHANPCGVGVADDLYTAYMKAYESDPVSIFGGIIAVNRALDGATAAKMAELFLEIIIAPDFTPEALEILGKKKNLRLLKLPLEENNPAVTMWDLKKVRGGLLIQDLDLSDVPVEEWKVVTKTQPTAKDLEELKFGWKVVKHVKSNAIVLTKDGGTIGVGAGQMNRVGSAKIAIEQAGAKAMGSYLASDAFFPMPDTVEEAAKAGIRAIVQPGGSIRDAESIEAADRYGLIMVFTGQRHFRH